MPRSYTQQTIKLLFGGASFCAFPGCSTPLVFVDRGARTVVAEIAHIRSESTLGPRHVPQYADFNDPANLVLLCGVHHKPVDQHASIYTVMDLEGWKLDQVAGAAAGGTTLTDGEAAALVRLTPAQLIGIDQITRLCYRLEVGAEAARTGLAAIELERRREREQATYRAGFQVIAVSENGTQTPIDPATITLGGPGEARFDVRRHDLILIRRAEFVDLMGKIGEEMAVLRARDDALGAAANVVVLAAQLVVETFHANEVLDLPITSVREAVARLNDIAAART